jgi:soluble lytic murein transglycosylase-like protein
VALSGDIGGDYVLTAVASDMAFKKANSEQVVQLLELMGGGKTKVQEMQDLLTSLGQQDLISDGVKGPKTEAAIRAVLMTVDAISHEDQKRLTPAAVMALRNAGERNVPYKDIFLPNMDVMSQVIGFDREDWWNTSKSEIAKNFDVLQSAVDTAHTKYPNVPKDVIYAVLAVESKGQSNVVSPMGAIGPMQIIPANFSGTNGQDFNPLDPEQGILGGTKMLSGYIKAYGSDEVGITKALTAYNQGQRAVNNAISTAAANQTNTLGKVVQALAAKPVVEKIWLDYIKTDEGRTYAIKVDAYRQGNKKIPGYFGTPR